MEDEVRFCSFAMATGRCLTVKPYFPCRQSGDMSRTRRHSALTSLFIFYFKDSKEGLIVCVCTEQTGLQRQASSSSQRGPFTYPFWSHISSPPPSFFIPSKSSGFLFSRSGAYHLLLHRRCPRLPILLSANERIFWGIDFVCPA